MSEVPRGGVSVRDRLAAGFLLVLLAVGSLMLWMVVPGGWLWLVAQITDSGATHLVVGIVGMPVALILFGMALVWINRLYMRIVWDPAEPQDLDEEDEEEWRVPRGPLEPMLVGSLLIAIVAMAVWFFIFAEYPLVSIY